MHKPVAELALIEQIRSGSRGGARFPCVALGIGDDCAILRPPRGHEVLVTTDFTLEGRHFRRDWHPPQSVGHRALARGLSDLAAMGARPQAAFLSLALPAEMLGTRAGRLWVTRFFEGLRYLAGLHNCPLAGGDTAESPADLVLADIVLVGTAPAGRALRRSAARPGDALYVTGALGGAAAELGILSRTGKPGRRVHRVSMLRTGPVPPNPQLYPWPRIEVGLALLRRHLATAAIDLSDGFSTDLTHICRESGVGAEVLAAALPIHPLAAKLPQQAIRLALHGGEDYELLFTAPASVTMPRSVASVPITRIGQITRGSALVLIDATGRRSPLRPGGWEHFTSA
jgi:thiamine-monophosphate kinase